MQSDASAPAALGPLAQQLAEDEDIAASFYASGVQAHMGGALFVRAIEVPETLPQTAALDSLPDSRPSFLRLTFREALDAFMARRIVTPDEWAALNEAARLQAFTATRLASEQLVARAYEALRRHVDNGGTLRSFIDSMRDGSESLGVLPASPGYLENVYRTNVQQAYGQGRLQQLESPAVMAARPYVQYRTAGDNRVRPSHAALNGVVFNRAEDSGWKRYAPPLGYQCRCSVVTVRRPDMSRLVVSSQLPPDVGPEPGWSGPGSAG